MVSKSVHLLLQENRRDRNPSPPPSPSPDQTLNNDDDGTEQPSAQQTNNDAIVGMLGSIMERLTKLEEKKDEGNGAQKRHKQKEKDNGEPSSKKGRMDHEISESESQSESNESEESEEESGDESYMNLDNVFGEKKKQDVDSEPEGALGVAIKGLQDLFRLDEEAGDDINPALANILNDTMRKRPSGDYLKKLTAKYKRPGNVPSQKVPQTNREVFDALGKSARYMDVEVQKTQQYLLKSLVPLITFINDVGTGKSKKITDYVEPLNDSLRLVTAAFTSLVQVRRDIARNDIRDYNFNKLCSWDNPIGVDYIFEGDVTKKCSDMAKSKKLGSKYKFGKRRFRNHGSGYKHNSYGYKKGYGYKKRNSYKKRDSFLGKRKQKDKKDD